MIKRDILSWWFRPQFLQPWGRPARTLFAGPWLGEFGWELMNWQPFLRWLAPRYQKVIVSCRKGNEALYRDFADDFIFHNIECTSECNRALKIQTPTELTSLLQSIPANSDILQTVGWQPSQRKKFVRFGSSNSKYASDILIHPRGRSFGRDRNWSPENWNLLVESLTKKGLVVGCIGLGNATLDVEGVDRDWRDIPLGETMDIIASTKLVVGPSSGPMHLASLCGTPHLVWTDTERYARGHTNRVKYESWWNPHGAPARVLDSWGFDPPVKTVQTEIMRILQTGL